MPAHSRHAEQGGRPPACGQGEKQAAGGQRAAGVAPGQLGSSPTGLRSFSVPLVAGAPGSKAPISSFSRVGVRWACVWRTVGTQPRSPAAPVLETVSPLGPSSHLLTQVHCALTCTGSVTTVGQAQGGAMEAGRRGPSWRSPRGWGQKSRSLWGVPEDSPTHFPKQRRKATCPGSHSTLPDYEALKLPASTLSPPLENQV